jgi:hypothetical protein
VKAIKGLIIDAPPIDNILSGRKTWEMRSTATKQRGPVALIRKGSGKVVGVAEIIDSIGPLSDADILANQDKHLISQERIRSGAVAKWKHAWILKNVRSLERPVSYRHPSGAVIWVNLSVEEVGAIANQAGIA